MPKAKTPVGDAPSQQLDAVSVEVVTSLPADLLADIAAASSTPVASPEEAPREDVAVYHPGIAPGAVQEVVDRGGRKVLVERRPDGVIIETNV